MANFPNPQQEGSGQFHMIYLRRTHKQNFNFKHFCLQKKQFHDKEYIYEEYCMSKASWPML